MLFFEWSTAHSSTELNHLDNSFYEMTSLLSLYESERLQPRDSTKKKKIDERKE